MDWSAAVLLLASRFEDDQEDLKIRFRFASDIAIDRFESFPSDPHAGGQSVAILRLTTGDRLVYKPTDQSLAALWSCASELCFGERGGVAPPLLRAGYGGQAFVDAAPAVD